MSLQDELDALRAEFVRSAPPGRAALYDAKVDELRRRDRSDSSQTTQGVAIRCGTGSSNPALSSRESDANLTSAWRNGQAKLLIGEQRLRACRRIGARFAAEPGRPGGMLGAWQAVT
jgi:hypothetical protein